MNTERSRFGYRYYLSSGYYYGAGYYGVVLKRIVFA